MAFDLGGDSPVPLIIGSAGLTGRPQVRPAPELDTDYDENGYPVATKAAGLPSPCLRLLAIPYRADGGHECDPYCPGRQRDGSCLTDQVRGLTSFAFEVDAEGFWNLCATSP